MKYKKFLLIPVLLFIYIFFVVDLLVNFNPTIYSPTTTAPSGGGQEVGVGQSISVLVTRPYFFNLIRLPVYTDYGYIGHYHQAFFYFIGVLTVLFIIIELRNWKSTRVKKVK